MKIKTLDGKLIDYNEIKHRKLLRNPRKLMEVLDEATRRNPAAFAEACAMELGIVYAPPEDKDKTIQYLLLFCAALENNFGYFTENMISALANYPIGV